MKGFPKTIGTGKDLLNLISLAQANELSVSDLKAAISQIEARQYITCPIISISSDRKTVTINYCPEAKASQVLYDGNSISTVTHQKSNSNAPGYSDNAPDQTAIVLESALDSSETTLKIPSPVNPLNSLGISQDQFNSIKGVINQL
jgi:hypothetical protein